MSKGKYYFSKSLEKGLKVLLLFNGETPVLTQSEIARKLGLNMTSTYRYINTLEELGVLEKDAISKQIRPSLLCGLLCSNLMRATNHLRMIQEYVDRIHRENNISIDVAYVVDDALMRIYHRAAEETLIYRLPDHSKNCLHNTALGKAYLASLPDDLLAETIDRLVFTIKTNKTIADKAALLKALQTVRARQYAMAQEEYLSGLLAIGAALRHPVSGKGVGAVSFDFSVLQHTAAQIEDKYGNLIRETAGMLSRLLPPDHGLLHVDGR